MAIITLKELISIIESHPEYDEKWKLEVAASEALAIRFDNQTSCDAETFETRDGGPILTVDIDGDGYLVAIEID